MARFAVNDKVQIKVPEDALYDGCSATVKAVLRDDPGVYKVQLDVLPLGAPFIVGENEIEEAPHPKKEERR